MNPRIQKEIRAILPAFSLVVFAPILLFFSPEKTEGLVVTCFVLGCAMMAALSFGHEFQHQTIGLLLAQPVPRLRLWREKMQVLGAALVIGTGVLGAGFSLADRRVFDPDFYWMAFAFVPVCSFCGGPLFTLFSRSTLLGTILPLSFPWSILLPVGLVVEGVFHSPRVAAILSVALLLAYCTLCWKRARDIFQELPVQEGTGASRELALPPGLEALVMRSLNRLSARFTGSFASLVRKEIRLQQTSFLMAGIFVVVAVVGACVYKAQAVLHWQYPIAEPILVCDFALFIILLPFLAGALSVAEEKTWRVADWHLTLPPSSGQQWFAKMLVAHCTSLILGLALPAALALAGRNLLRADADGSAFPPQSVILGVVIGYLFLTSLVIYAGCLSRGTIGAIILAFGMIVGTCFLINVLIYLIPALGLGTPHFWWEESIPPNELAASYLTIGMLVLLCLLQRCAFACYRQRGLTSGGLTIQALTLVAAVCASAFFVILGPDLL